MRLALAAVVVLTALVGPRLAGAFVPPLLGAPTASSMALIPATTANLGGSRTAGSESFHSPENPVALRAFHIDRTEVTVGAYSRCVAAGTCPPPNIVDCEVHAGTMYGIAGRESYPMSCVSYDEAERYCRFVNKRLPTGPEWEVALRGPQLFTFPWGNELPAPGRTNGCDHRCAIEASAATGSNYEPVWSDKDFDDGFAFSAPVGTFVGDMSPYGVLDLAANVAEWTDPKGEPSDLGGAIAYSLPAGVASQGMKQVRGGSWATNVYSTMTFAGRDTVDGAFRGAWVGFRCARDAAP